jgi:hypothetical protein
MCICYLVKQNIGVKLRVMVDFKYLPNQTCCEIFHEIFGKYQLRSTKTGPDPDPHDLVNPVQKERVQSKSIISIGKKCNVTFNGKNINKVSW